MTLLSTIAGCGAAGKPGVTTAQRSTGAPLTSTPPSESPPPSDTKASAALIAKADAICKRLDAHLIAAPPGHLDLSAIARSAPHNAELERHVVASLSKLIPPVTMTHDWAQIIAYRRTLTEELLKLGRAAKAGDRAAVEALGASKKRVHEGLYALATRDGFKSCAEATAASGTAPARPTAKENTATASR